MTNGERDEVADRLSRRFDTDDENHEKAQNDENDKSDSKDMQSQTSSNDKTSQKVKNVKTEWTATSVYLPDDLDEDLGRTYKRLDLDLDAELSQFKKTRHYYPLVVAAGLDALDDMEKEEIVALLGEIQP
jgi:hypothetical protein